MSGNLTARNELTERVAHLANKSLYQRELAAEARIQATNADGLADSYDELKREFQAILDALPKESD